MIILKFLLFLLIFLLLLIIWAIIFPRSFWLEYDKFDGFTAKVKFAFVKFKIFPFPRKSSAEPGEREEKEEKEKNKKSKGGHKVGKKQKSPLDDLEMSFGLLKQALSSLNNIIKKLLHSFKIRDLSFTVPIYDPDPYKLQSKFGAVTGSFYSLNTVLSEVFNLTYKAPKFIADFDGSHSDSLYFYCKITLSPLPLIIRAIYALIKYREIKKDNKKVTEPLEKEI